MLFDRLIIEHSRQQERLHNRARLKGIGYDTVTPVAVLLLKRIGCRVEVAANGLDAVMMVREGNYDVVLMDCQMPEMDGYEATRQIRKLPGGVGQVPIIAMTAHALSGDRKVCMEAGMDDYVPKPVTLKMLRERLEHALSGRVPTATVQP